MSEGPDPSADAVEKELGADLDQTGRANRLNHGSRHTDHAVAIQVLMETGFGDFDRAARSRHRLRRRDEVAAAVGGPNENTGRQRLFQATS